MIILQISIPDKKEKAIRLLLRELGISVKKVNSKKPLLRKVKTAVDELNDIKFGKIEAKDFDDVLNTLTTTPALH